MNNQKRLVLKNSKGFTLVETLVAIFILLLTITAMITLSTGSFYNVRYAQNQLVASTLNQEMFEYIRHNRDTYVQKDPENGFAAWVNSIYTCVTDQYYCDINQFEEYPENRISFRGSSFSFLLGGIIGGAPDSRNPIQLKQYPSGVKVSFTDNLPSSSTLAGTTAPSAFSRGIQFRIYPVTPTQVEVIVVTRWKNGSVDKELRESIILADW